MGRFVIALVGLTACSFSTSITNETPVEPDAAPQPIQCGDLTCDPYATCLADPARCECGGGFTGNGMTCADVDECATAGSCPAACLNKPGTFECYVPQSCADVKAKLPSFTTGNVTLYLGGNAAQPWTAFCAANGKEYLSLTSAANYAQYSRDSGADVRTTYTKIRIVPGTTAVVDIDDKTFATSTGSLMHGGDTVTSMPYAIAMDCEGSGNSSGVASIDLANTPFVVDDPFETRGSGAAGSSNVMNGGRQVTLSGGGNCGWRSPAPAPFNPYNSIGASPILDLAYAP